MIPNRDTRALIAMSWPMTRLRGDLFVNFVQRQRVGISLLNVSVKIPITDFLKPRI